MKTIKVKDLMVPLDEYATVPHDATLYEAAAALENAQESFNRNHYRHRAVLVLDENNQVVGKLSQRDVLEALEPGYRTDAGAPKGVTQFTASFVKAIQKHHTLWAHPLDDICRKAVDIRVKDVMSCPGEGEYVSENTLLDQAIHQFVIGHHQSLLVTGKGKQVVGVLRLADVFLEVYKVMMKCQSSPLED